MRTKVPGVTFRLTLALIRRMIWLWMRLAFGNFARAKGVDTEISGSRRLTVNARNGATNLRVKGVFITARDLRAMDFAQRHVLARAVGLGGEEHDLCDHEHGHCVRHCDPRAAARGSGTTRAARAAHSASDHGAHRHDGIESAHKTCN